MNIRKRNSLTAGILLAGCLSLLILRYGFGLSIPCPLKSLTGIPCPGCGGMRTLDALLHGYLLQALSINPLSFLLIFAVAGSSIWLVTDAVRHSDSFFRLLKRLDDKRFLHLSLLLLMIIWIRNILLNI